MNDNSIKVGDLVVIVDGCCARARAEYVGGIFTVDRIYSGENLYCYYNCGSVATHTCAVTNTEFKTATDRGNGAPVEWLRRIRPSEQVQNVKRPEEITA